MDAPIKKDYLVSTKFDRRMVKSFSVSGALHDYLKDTANDDEVTEIILCDEEYISRNTKKYPTFEQEAREKVIGELVEWMEEMKSSGSSVYYPLTLKYCIQKAKSLLKQEGEYAAMQNEQTKDVCRCAVPLGKKGNCQRCGGQIWF